MGRYVHWAEWSELLHICKELQDGLANMRVHLHQLPPPYYTSAYADYYVQATPSDILRDTAAYTDDVQATSPYTDDVLEKPSDGSSDTASPAYVDRDVQVTLFDASSDAVAYTDDVQVMPSETSSDAVSYRDEEQVPVILIDVDVSSRTTANADDVHETLSNASPDTAVAASSSSSTPTLVSSDTDNGQATPDTALSSSPTTPDVSDTLAYANDVQITLANACSDTAASSSSTTTLVESSTSAPSSPPKTSSPPLPAPAPAKITEPAAVHDKVDVVPRTPSPVLEAPEQVMRETIPAGQSHTSALQAHPEQSSITSRHGHTARDDSDYDTDSEDSLEGYGSEVVRSPCPWDRCLVILSDFVGVSPNIRGDRETPRRIHRYLHVRSIERLRRLVECTYHIVCRLFVRLQSSTECETPSLPI